MTPKTTWRVPLWGHICDEVAPSWLVQRLLSRELVINHLGGFDHLDGSSEQRCAAGDTVVFDPRHQTISFRPLRAQ